MIDELIVKIKACKNMGELDNMRLDLVRAGKGDPEHFKSLQDAFIKRKNQIKRGGSRFDS